MLKQALLLCFTLLIALSGAAGPGRAESTLTLLTHESFEVNKDSWLKFQNDSNIKIRVLKVADAGQVCAQVLLNRDKPVADVVFGLDNTFMGRALAADVFQPIRPEAAGLIADDLKLDPSGRLWPVDFGDAGLNYDRAALAEAGLRPPESLAELAGSPWRGQLVIPNPAISSPGLAFLFTTAAVFGENEYLDFWRKLDQNGLKIVNSWQNAYYGEFSGAGQGGGRSLVWSYVSSPAAEVHFSADGSGRAVTGAVVKPATTFRQVEFVGIPKGAANPEGALKLVNFMLSPEFQKDLPLNVFMYPANSAVPLPEVFQRYAPGSEAPIIMPPEIIDANREKWLNAWRNLFR